MCAHPALDRPSQLALTLRLISGLTVAEIARALLQSEAAVGQRINRAKNKIRHANILLGVLPPELLPERTPHLLACIYSVFTGGYWSTAGPYRLGVPGMSAARPRVRRGPVHMECVGPMPPQKH